MNKKKVMLLLVSMLTVVLVSIGGTMAYLTDTSDVTNTMAIGNVNIEIKGDANSKKALAPGESANKNPSVANVGENACWIRVKVDMPTFTGGVNSAQGDLFALNEMDTNKWTIKQKDGYYYYQAKVASGNTTSDLFKGVTLNENYIEGCDLAGLVMADGQPTADVIVYAEAVQADGLKATTAKAAFTEVGQVETAKK